LKNTVKYVINTIRRIIRLRRMTHPCKFESRHWSSTCLSAAFPLVASLNHVMPTTLPDILLVPLSSSPLFASRVGIGSDFT